LLLSMAGLLALSTGCGQKEKSPAKASLATEKNRAKTDLALHRRSRPGEGKRPSSRPTPVKLTDSLHAKKTLESSSHPRKTFPGRMVLLDFDGTSVPTNKEGRNYPTYYHDPTGRKEGGKFEASIFKDDAISGSSLKLHLVEGALYAQFNPYMAN